MKMYLFKGLNYYSLSPKDEDNSMLSNPELNDLKRISKSVTRTTGDPIMLA